MFGLMKPRGKAPSSLPLQHQRLHYCGVCKAMGQHYGQRTRVTLNYDAVFLAELLGFLGPVPESYAHDWAPELLSYNCLRLPGSADIPVHLSYAAAVNVLLAGIKIEDNRLDRGGFVWRAAGKLYEERTARAEADLAGFGLDLAEIDHWLREHHQREKSPGRGRPAEHLNYMAEATSRITGAIFRQGAVVMGRGDQKANMEDIGRHFGRMIYLLDAFRDYEKDGKKGEYNPIRVAYGDADKLPGEEREAVKDTLLRTAAQLLKGVEMTGIRKDGQLWFKKRIEDNLKEQLGITEEEIKSCALPSASKNRRKIPLRKRVKFLGAVGRSWRSPEIKRRNAAWRKWTAYGMVSGLALLFPGFLHAKSDWFSHIDPDFLSRFGDLHPDWSPKAMVAMDCCNNGQCCDQCCGNGGCCDACSTPCNCDCQCGADTGCCNNCCTNCNAGCNEAGNNISNFFRNLCIGAVALILGSIALAITWGRINRRKQNRQNADEAFSRPLRIKVKRPDQDLEMLTNTAKGWFQAHFPQADPQLNWGGNHDSLVGFHEMPMRVGASGSGSAMDLGRVRFRISIHMLPGLMVLEFDQFEHLGAGKCQAGGDLANPRPGSERPPLDIKAWRTIKGIVRKQVEGLLAGFEREV